MGLMVLEETKKKDILLICSTTLTKLIIEEHIYLVISISPSNQFVNFFFQGTICSPSMLLGLEFPFRRHIWVSLLLLPCSQRFPAGSEVIPRPVVKDRQLKIPVPS